MIRLTSEDRIIAILLQLSQSHLFARKVCMVAYLCHEAEIHAPALFYLIKLWAKFLSECMWCWQRILGACGGSQIWLSSLGTTNAVAVQSVGFGEIREILFLFQQDQVDTCGISKKVLKINYVYNGIFSKFRSTTWKFVTYLSRNDAASAGRRWLQSCWKAWLVGATGVCNDCKAQWWPSTSWQGCLWCMLLIRKCSYTVIVSILLNDTYVSAEALFCFFSTFCSP